LESFLTGFTAGDGPGEMEGSS